MTSITLDVPDDLAQKLQLLEPDILHTVLNQVLLQLEDPTDLTEFVRLPSAPLPDYTPPLSQEAWRENLLTVSTWSEADLEEFGEAKEYIKQWQAKSV